ncbi:hypothetical protein SteCoe_20829 [Stentor coeruleus]|uniref:Uncharacterized protein n=1 Tax=Stentor coeruleus TaxID=5963 RepID=A0A1R2BQX0_9CILI|nr:hypothetical protein SteCoe_20829 [Stentor coeruleus]
MSDELLVFKPQTATKSSRFSVNLNNKKLSFPCETSIISQELPRIGSNFLEAESAIKRQTLVSRIPKDSNEFIKSTYQKIISTSDIKKRLSIKLIDKSSLDDQMSYPSRDIHLLPPEKKKRSSRLVIKSSRCSLSPRCSLDRSFNNSDFSNKSSDGIEKNGDNKMNFTAAANKALNRKMPARFSVVTDSKSSLKPKTLHATNLKDDLMLLLENKFGNLQNEFLIEKKHRDTTDKPLMPNILKRMNDENWKWEAPEYDFDNEKNGEETNSSEENS